ncbi:uncharacterized protein LOC127005238 [Eriocheir sinensis]|uniref:uncharacterized protein LOC127005238 n=1 Tax=Eriocheir sinensis TaxID=95602 RepID=UPI0021C86AEB|nr:uncharacterized protein LOC127005238 [Eriocheir sinensis]
MDGPTEHLVFTLRPEEEHDAVVQVKQEFPVERLSENFTVCQWMWPLYPRTISNLFIVSDPASSITAKTLEGRVLVAVNTSCLTSLNTTELHPNAWQHMCLALTGGTLTLHLDGQTYRKKVSDMEECRGTISSTRNVTVQVGMDDGQLTYSGRVSGVRYYDRELLAAEVIGLQGCEDMAGDYMRVTNVTMIGNVSHFDLNDPQRLCQPEPKEFVALFSLCGHHFQARRLCARMGGRLINQTDDLDTLMYAINLSLDVEDTSLFLWMNEMVTEDTGRVLSINRHTQTYHMLTYSCGSELFNTACVMPLGKTVYMKCNNTVELTLQNYNRRLVLLSKMGEMIRREPCQQLGVDSETRRCLSRRSVWMQEYTPLEEGQDIFGRKSWAEQDPAMDGRQKLSITLCEDGKFTCNDGSCIALWLRCDGVPHCEDNSDEGNVCTFLKPPPPSYWKGACPNTQPVVGLIANVFRVTSVSLDTNEFKVNLEIITSWRDHRLTFQNLQNSTKILPAKDFSLLWTPTLQFPEAHYEDNLNILTKTSVLEGFKVMPVGKGRPETENSYEVMQYNGSDVEIQHTMQYQFTFSCEYDFLSFPFDTQECGMQINLLPSLGCDPRWDTQSGGVQVYGEGSTLSMYSISPARYNLEDGRSVVALRLLFTHKFSAYVMTTFCPCIILCLLAHVTLTHFQLTDFNDRIMVTLSLLIVLASLFSQLSSTLPSSPVSKLVDHFFFYCIVRVSLIFLIHSSIELSLRSSRKAEDAKKDTSAVIHGDDPMLGIQMKLAWVSEPAKETKESPKKGLNKPAIINNAGCVLLLVLDVVVAAVLSDMAVSSHREKYDRFQACNVTLSQ